LIATAASPPAAWAPPTVADAKLKFTSSFKKPLPAIYSTVVQELLVQQHLYRWNKRYQYNEVPSPAARPSPAELPLACASPPALASQPASRVLCRPVNPLPGPPRRRGRRPPGVCVAL
jgi:hypothetical protein